MEGILWYLDIFVVVDLAMEGDERGSRREADK